MFPKIAMQSLERKSIRVIVRSNKFFQRVQLNNFEMRKKVLFLPFMTTMIKFPTFADIVRNMIGNLRTIDNISFEVISNSPEAMSWNNKNRQNKGINRGVLVSRIMCSM